MLKLCLAVQSRVFPLVEVENGETWRLTVEPDGTPVAEYLRREGRFRHLGEGEVRAIQEQVDERRALIERRVARGS